MAIGTPTRLLGILMELSGMPMELIETPPSKELT
jgi:hypothetical protein